MKIIICSSISAADEVLRIKSDLERRGHEVEIPAGIKHPELRRIDADNRQKADVKIEHDLIRGYYEKIKLFDKVLVVNPRLKEIDGYIGGNAFLEMGFAHVLNKPLYCLYPLPEMTYSSELLAMQPIILNNNLSKIEE